MKEEIKLLKQANKRLQYENYKLKKSLKSLILCLKQRIKTVFNKVSVAVNANPISISFFSSQNNLLLIQLDY